MKNNKSNIEDISTDKFLTILSNYYSVLYREDFTMRYDLSIENNHLDLKVYFQKYLCGTLQKVYLKEEEIREPLEQYVKNQGYVLDNYKYLGGIRHAGYFVDEDTPYFEGIRLILKEKSKTKTRNR